MAHLGRPGLGPPGSMAMGLTGLTLGLGPMSLVSGILFGCVDACGDTRQKTNMSPENQWLEDVFHILK